MIPKGGKPKRILKLSLPLKLVCPSIRGRNPDTLNLNRSIVMRLFLISLLISIVESLESLSASVPVLSLITLKSLKPFICTSFTESTPPPLSEG